jgi:hypothetical protein
MIDKKKKTQKNKLFTKKKKKKKKTLKIGIISKIKRRSKNKNISNEISKDIEKINLEPENLILLDYIDKKISKS